jgi:3-hydroxypropanoate dehydrogenase
MPAPLSNPAPDPVANQVINPVTNPLPDPLHSPRPWHGPLPGDALDQLFRNARSLHTYIDRPVTDETLRQLYELVRMGPTGFNSQPARYVFVRSPEAKALLSPALSSGNRAKTLAAPVTAIVAYDLRFFDRLPELFPSYDARPMFESSPELTEQTAVRNGALQAAYLILAARALGLDAGPMSGFKGELIDKTFFPDGHTRTLFLINLGYGERSRLGPRLPRLSFEQAARVV